ncbi:50S ribosomal subunit protein L11 [Alphaproteobacteria bacterium]
MKKKVTGEVKLQIPAGKANPAPPIGSALGPKGVNIGEFCKQFNEKTKELEVGMPLPVVITIYADRSFTFITKTPPTSYLIKKYAKVDKGAKTPGREIVGEIDADSVVEIAKMKMHDMGIDNLDSAIRSVEGTALSLGLVVSKR